MFSYFESSIDGIIPNEYDSIQDICVRLFTCLLDVKDICMLTARRFWITQMQFPPITKQLLQTSVSTATTPTVTNSQLQLPSIGSGQLSSTETVTPVTPLSLPSTDNNHVSLDKNLNNLHKIKTINKINSNQMILLNNEIRSTINEKLEHEINNKKEI